ncbi:MAG: M24 family metallopeptidase, partial [Actinomycetota bacterium]
IGLDAHEQPYIVEGSSLAIEAGMAFSIEPGIYVPGRWGMRIEDIVVAVDGGVERLNRSARALRIVQ